MLFRPAARLSGPEEMRPMRTSFAIRFALVGIGTLAFASCTKPQETPFYKKVPVTRQDVIVTVK